MKVEEMIPRWQKELENFKGIKSTFIVEGNINDLYPTFFLDDQGELERIDFFGLNRAIVNIFDSSNTQGFYQFLFCDPLFGFSDPLNSNATQQIVARCENQVRERNKLVKSLNGSDKPEAHSDNKMIQTSEIIREALTQASNEDENKRSVAVVVNFASHYLSTPDGLSNDETTFFLNLLYASQYAIRGNRFINTLILVVDKFNDIPAWFFLNNPNVRTVSVPNPDRTVRECYINRYFKDLSEEANLALKAKFVDLTDGMKLIEVGELRRLHQKLQKPINEIADTVAIYKYGFKDSPWEKIRDKVEDDMVARIENRVMGQRQAVDRIVQVIKRSVTGLSGMQHSSESSKPRGILFLAGPTGTGKTEIVKAVTEMLFEDERALIRFDMSEYTAEHADQKLFGAPPGYVGYDNGGQLTNAVKNNPVSILLFDEIEKAHPSIMDKFLQILEDGRMTDGQGNTVYFSETIIFFTSNVGISKEITDPITGRVIGRENIVKPGEPYSEIEKKVKEAMEIYFKPEVINRIGNNIVVFNYIDETASQVIARAKIKKINNNILKKKHITISIDDSVLKHMYALCWEDEPRANGGRGIGNVIEESYLNPLSEFIFDYRISEGDSVVIREENNSLVFSKG